MSSEAFDWTPHLDAATVALWGRFEAVFGRAFLVAHEILRGVLSGAVSG